MVSAWDFCVLEVLKKIGDKYLVINVSTEDEDVPEVKKVVRGEMMMYLTLREGDKWY